MRLLAALATLAVTFTACWEDIPAGDYTSVYFWSDVFWDKYEAQRELGVLEPGPARLETPRTVLLVTGVTIRAGWFDGIKARLERDGFVTVVYEPPALLSGNLFQASVELKAVVERVQAQSGQDKIDILAECTGGLIARYYLQALGGDAKVRSLVTFVSPQHGVAKAPLAADIAGWPALDDLSPGSSFLNAVNDAPLPAGVPITSIYSCTDEYIQPYETSIIPGATNIGLACNGGFVGHFQTMYDPTIYPLMHDALVRPTPAELAAASTPDPVVDPTDPTAADPTDPTEADPTDPTDPTEVDPSDPTEADPTDPADPTSTIDPSQLPSDTPMAFDAASNAPPEADLGCSSSGDPSLLAALGLALVALTTRRLTATAKSTNDAPR